MISRLLVPYFVLASIWLAAPLLADEPAGGARVDRYALEHYLTDIAEQAWRSRQAELVSLRTPADVTARADRIRADFLEAIGGLPTTDAPLNARITGVLERDGYRVEKLVYESLPGFFVTANVYVPTDRPGPFPAILGACGHSRLWSIRPHSSGSYGGAIWCSPTTRQSRANGSNIARNAATPNSRGRSGTSFPACNAC
jgi:hypothetical protein